MADPSKFTFDVWLTHAGTVYRAVPFNVVTDWIQQGRLLEDDRIRPVGTEQWMILGEIPAFAGFIPRSDSLRTDAQAEALEPVESGFAWGGQREGEEADPDMIPLIDVSLVLLIFFMLTSTVAIAASKIKVPEALNPVELTVNTDMVWIGINYVADDQPPSYTITFKSEDGQKSSFDKLDKASTLQKLDEVFTKQNRIPEVRVAAHRQLAFDLIKDLAVDLEKHKSLGRIGVIKIEVGEKKR